MSDIQVRSTSIIIQFREENHDLMSQRKTNRAVLTEMDTKSLVIINACYVQDHRSWIVLLLRQAYAAAEHEWVKCDAKTKMLSKVR